MIRTTLVGNPNTGKTTLFNSLTGGHEHVGNWHGVTVEEKVGRYVFNGEEISIVDLPGIYSLSPLSFEEQVAVEYLEKNSDDIVINICDASNLQRNLYLTLSLLEMGLNVVMVVNQIDKRPICKIDYAKLERVLGIKIVYLNAGDKNSVQEINKFLLQQKSESFENGTGENVGKTLVSRPQLPYLASIELDKTKGFVDKRERAEDFYAIKLLEDDERVKDKVGLQNMEFGGCESVAKARYDFIDSILKDCASPRERVYGKSKVDKIFLNRFLAIPIFLCMLAGVFYLTFFSVGKWLSDGLAFLLERFVSAPLLSFIENVYGAGSWIYSLFNVAIFGGVGSVLSFLPQVALLFLFLSILEDSGYLSRVAFVMDDILSKVGLSGKSVYTLLMGFGCSTSAVLTARNMEDKNAKIKTALLTPYMSCSAKFPVYAVLGGVFFGANNIFVILGLYLLGVVIAILLSYIFEKTLLKSKQQSFILEFPPYRMMSAKRTLSVLWQNIKLFLGRVGTLIIAMNVVVWVLSNFSISFRFVGNGRGISMLETFGKILSPLFVPLGFDSWGLVAGLISGLVAKEVIVSSIGMFAGRDGFGAIESALLVSGSAVYFASKSAVVSYLVFCLLYFPCFATMSVMSKEIGKKWTAIGMLVEFVTAYITAFVVFTLARCFEVFGFWTVFLMLVSVKIIFVCSVVIWKRVKAKKLCPYGKSCQKDCKRKEKM